MRFRWADLEVLFAADIAAEDDFAMRETSEYRHDLPAPAYSISST